MNKKTIVLIVIAVLILLGIVGSCSSESEYEKAQKNFSSWSKKDPDSWSDSEKQVFNDYIDWLGKQ